MTPLMVSLILLKRVIILKITDRGLLVGYVACYCIYKLYLYLRSTFSIRTHLLLSFCKLLPSTMLYIEGIHRRSKRCSLRSPWTTSCPWRRTSQRRRPSRGRLRCQNFGLFSLHKPGKSSESSSGFRGCEAAETAVKVAAAFETDRRGEQEQSSRFSH